MAHNEGHIDFKQEHLEETNTLCQKQNDTNKHALLLDVSPAIKQEPDCMQQRQSSDATLDVSEVHGEESTFSCQNKAKKDSDTQTQKPCSNRGLPAQESNPPPVSLCMRDSSEVLKDEPTDVHLRQIPDSGVKTTEVCDQERTSVENKKVAGILPPVRCFGGVSASQSDKLKPTQSTQHEKTLEKLLPRRNPDGGGCTPQSDQVAIHSVVPERLSIVPKESQAKDSHSRQCIYAKNHALLSKEEKGISIEGESVSQNLVQMSSSSIGVGQETYPYPSKFEKVEKLQPRRNPDPVVQESQSGAESNPSKVLDRGSNDGYNWRKYGQKLVKGNKFIRSYYKCTYPNCQAKKQVERSQDGCKTDLNYLGNHYHEKPQQSSLATSALQVGTPDMQIVPASETNSEPTIDHGAANQYMVSTETSPQSAVARSGDGVQGAVSHSQIDDMDKDGHQDSKRQKRERASVDDHAMNKSNCDLRHVVQTLSEVDLVNDGYRWRKYGQKLVKGNPNPRSYYRCSFSGCPAKKHVERSSHDPKVVITTYEGKHDHDMPASRTVIQSVARADANTVTSNGESSSNAEEKNSVSHEMAVHVSAN